MEKANKPKFKKSILLIVEFSILSILLSFLQPDYSYKLKNFDKPNSPQDLTKSSGIKKNNQDKTFLIKLKENNSLPANRKNNYGENFENENDHPDLYAQFEKGIRTRDGESSPGYLPNYRMRELLKSRKVNSLNELNKISKKGDVNWVERGPGNVSGRTRSIIVDPDDPNHNTWFAGSVGGGIWKTTDAGKSWKNLTGNILNLATSSLAMAQSNHNVIYAGTGEGFKNIDEIDGTGIWKTTDKGLNWVQLASTANNKKMQNITRIIVDPSNENTLLVSATPGFNYYSASNSPHSGIFRSTNGGTSWKMVYDSWGNSVEQIIANPKNFNTLYASINSFGIIKSYNGGLSWKGISYGIRSFKRMEIAIAPTDTSTLYLSAEGGGNSNGSFLYVSDDGGNHWLSLKDTAGNKNWLGKQGWYNNAVAVDPYNKNIVYAGGIGLWRFNRIGGTDTSKKQIISVDQDNISSFLSFFHDGLRYAGGGLDIGEYFHGLPAHLNDSDYTSVEIRFGPGEHQKAHRFLYAPSFQYKYKDYVDVPFEVWDIDHNRQLMVSFRDQDYSTTWNPEDGTTAPEGISREYIFINAVPYDSTKPDTNIAKTAGMAYKNTYAFWPKAPYNTRFDPNRIPKSLIRINWGNVLNKHITSEPIADVYNQYGGTSKGVHPDQHNITLVKTNESEKKFRIIVCNDGGIFYSDDKGSTFIQTANGYNTAQFYGVDKMNGSDRYIGGTQDNGSWLSPSDASAKDPWIKTLGGDGFEVACNYDNPDLILESSQYNSIYKTTDGGLHWFNANSENGLKDIGYRAPFFTKIAKSNQEPDLIFAVGALGVWRSDNFASNWTLIPITRNYYSGNDNFARVKISLANPQIVWAGSGMADNRKIFVSADGGLTFKPTNNYTDVKLGYITNIETDPLNDSTAYILFSIARTPKILKTTNLGNTWKDISGFGTDTVSSSGFPDVAVYSLLVMPYNSDIIWAGTEIGIFQSTDSGKNWAYLDNGFPATAVWQMEIVNDEIVAATHGRGIWTLKIPELSGYSPPQITRAPRLQQILYNPSGSLIIRFTLRSIYDSTSVIINNNTISRLAANNSVVDSVILFSPPVPEEDSIQIFSYKDKYVYKSNMIITHSRIRVKPRNSYVNNFNLPSNNFSGNGFSSYNITHGFGNSAIQSLHPYSNNKNYIYKLLIPIIVSNGDASLSYDDIAIVEPGFSDSVPGDSNFSDYVIVEGTKDGLNWLPLIKGYDSRTDSTWLKAFTSNEPGDSTMYRNHLINLKPAFSAGDTILIRFRLFSDNKTNGWGWAIDNVNIQGFPVSAELTSFNCFHDEDKITLTWQTNSEKNNNRFEIERSSDKLNFIKVGSIQGNGTTEETHNYSFTDNSTTGGNFYYRLKIIDLSGHYSYSNVLGVSVFPSKFSLSQNFPNPFNPATTIKFQIPQQENVLLEIYNVTGKKVKTLISEIKPPGFYKVKWDGTNNNNINVATGIYIYRIVAGKFVVAKKMILLK